MKNEFAIAHTGAARRVFRTLVGKGASRRRSSRRSAQKRSNRNGTQHVSFLVSRNTKLNRAPFEKREAISVFKGQTGCRVTGFNFEKKKIKLSDWKGSIYARAHSDPNFLKYLSSRKYKRKLKQGPRMRIP